jgi:FkbH-like protein
MRDAEITPQQLLADAKALMSAAPKQALEALAAIPVREVSHFMSALQMLKRIPSDIRQQHAQHKLKIAVLGNATLNYLANAMQFFLSPRVYADVYLAEFDQWALELLDANSNVTRLQPDFVIVYLSALGLTQGGCQLDSEQHLTLFEQALGQFTARHPQTQIILVLPEPLPEALGCNTETDVWHKQVIARLEQSSQGHAISLNPLPVLLSLAAEWQALRYWYSAKLPLHPHACIALGKRLAQLLENISFPRIKAIAVDCDNTLWGGEVGDLGAEAVRLSPFDESAGYLRLQRLLKEAVERGLILVAVSKNELANVLAVFAQRSEMLLQKQDFAAFKVNWQPKSANLLQAAKELNLDPAHFLFIDDSAFERGEVKQALPQVLVADLPDSADEYAAYVNQLGVLERPLLSAEDRQRTLLYQQEQSRQQAFTATTSMENFLSGLDLRVYAAPIDAGNLARAAQLINKTNQFNLTTKRRTAQELSTFIGQNTVYAYCFQVRDRFGDAGIVGVCIALPKTPKIFYLDTLLLSCRVMARTVENAMLEHLRQWLQKKGGHLLYGEYLPTAKNKPVANLLLDFGFQRQENIPEPAGAYRCEREISTPFANPYASLIEMEST